MSDDIKKIVVVGGGTAGWISAACLAKMFSKSNIKIELIESPNIATIGVGEATIPSMIDFIRLLGIDFKDFIIKTNATFKLAIQFKDWRTLNHSYWHPFGSVGANIDGIRFYQHWLKCKRNGLESDFTDYSPSIAMAKNNKFVIASNDGKNPLSGSKFALHFDAALVAEYLKEYSIKSGVKHTRYNVTDVKIFESGFISEVFLDNQDKVSADFFIDCTGSRGLLIEKAMAIGYESWNQFLPCDRAVFAQTLNTDLLDRRIKRTPLHLKTIKGRMPTSSVQGCNYSESDNVREFFHGVPLVSPYTVSTALNSGWQWRIPLQNRVGNGYVYSSQFSDDDNAEKLFCNTITGELITQPKKLSFETGRRKKIWHKNCLAVGLSSGFLEPLESTSIHLIVKAIVSFCETFPSRHCDDATVNEYNRIMVAEYESIRDFIVLHYCTTQRTDTDFWRYCKAMEIPETLKVKLDTFKSQGRLYKNEFDLFAETSWYSVLEGMGVRPLGYDPMVDHSNFEEVKTILNTGLDKMNAVVSQLPTHNQFIKDIGGC